MKVKAKIDGRLIEVEVDEENLKETWNNHNGYERLNNGNDFYYTSGTGIVGIFTDGYQNSQYFYDNANYYSNERIARENTRADLLMRKLRRFAADHGALANPSKSGNHWSIGYYKDYENEDSEFELTTVETDDRQNCGEICFTSEDVCAKAIEEFRKELEWYYTEYCPALR